MVKVCDAIMGTGKSSAAINYMNEHSDRKFIYITPYLKEAERIKNGCRSLHFVEPSNKIQKYNFNKHEHTMALIKAGKNITTTHQSFKNYTQETIDLIKEQRYILIIDESVDVLEKIDVHPDDLQLAIDGGIVKEEDGDYSLTGKEYNGMALRFLYSFMKSRNLIKIDDGDGTFYFWSLPADLFTAFDDVFILTYLFDGQSLHYFLKMNNIEFKKIGIHKDDAGNFKFGDYPSYVPSYVKDIKNKIHILDNKRMNDVGNKFHDISMNWFDKNKEDVEILKRNVFNFFTNIHRDTPAEQRMWGSYSDAFGAIRGRGYSRAFINFNEKATNAYRKRTCLVYLVNIFMNVNEKRFYMKNGIDVNEDIYALSIMVQWIWRSAIRDGKEVYLYIPSKRMRTMLEQWMDDISKGGK